MEQAPGEPSFDFQSFIQPALDALGQQEGASKDFFNTTTQELTSEAGQQKEEAQGEQTRRLGGLANQRTREEGRTESAVGESRRQAAEIMQGLQSRFGGTTGTGRFASEITGSQATRNIATNRAALQDTMNTIGQAEEGVRNETSRILRSVEQNLATGKARARSELNQALANIASSRGELESRKAEMQMNALQNYQNLVADIGARNTAFKQTLYAKAQDAQDQISQLKARAEKSYSAALSPSQLGSLVNSGLDVESLPQGALPENLRGATFKSEEEDLF